MHISKSKASLTILLLFLIQSQSLENARAIPTPIKSTSPLPVPKVGLGGACYGSVDHPHPSSHEIGTYNIEASTSCAGYIPTVTIIVFRHAWGNYFQEIGRASKSQKNFVKTNVGFNCNWTKDKPDTLYWVLNTHSDGKNHFGYTGGKIYLKC